MTTHNFTTYAPSDLAFTSAGSGQQVMLRPDWSASDDQLHCSINDSDSFLDANPAPGDQSCTVTDSSSNTVASGQIYADNALSVSNGDGGTATLYSLGISGNTVSYAADAEIVPGASYAVHSVTPVDDTNEPAYADLHWSSYDHDAGQYYYGGIYDDDFDTGDGDDSVEAGDGDNYINAGAGNDTVYYGHSDTGDTVYGGDGNDLIDDEYGTRFVSSNQLYGEAGNDSIYAGNGADYASGGSGNDLVYGEHGDDTLDGGSGDDVIYGERGNDRLTGGDGDDTFRMSAHSGSDTVMDFDLGDDDGNGFTNDQLDVSGVKNLDSNPVTVNDVTVSGDPFGNAVLDFPEGEQVVLVGISPASVSDPSALYSMGIPCYLSGTRILTPAGEVAIEDLRPGDRVSTLSNGPQPILWLGKRSLHPDELARQPELQPIRIRNGTLGNRGDLLVSPQHGVLIGEGQNAEMVRAKHLARFGGGGFRQARNKRNVTYHHLLLPVHAVIFANGSLSESLFPGQMSLRAFDRATQNELFSLFPQLAQILSGADAEMLYGARAAPLVKRDRAQVLGQKLSGRRTAWTAATAALVTPVTASTRPRLAGPFGNPTSAN